MAALPFHSKAITDQTVLIADDSEIQRKILIKIIEEIGCHYLIAVDGQEAMDHIASHKVDLAILDIRMPVVSGEEVLRSVRLDPDQTGMSVIVLTGDDSVDLGVKCIGLGADDYLLKPIDPLLLRTRVSAQLERQRLKQDQINYLSHIVETNQRLEALVEEKVKKIEEQLATEGRLRAEKERIAQEIAVKDRYLALISHDLRSPLSSVISAIKLIHGNLKTRGFGPQEDTLCSGITSHVEQLLKMIDTLLDIERLKMGKIGCARRLVAVSPLVSKVIENLWGLTKLKDVVVHNETPEDTRAFADPQLLYQVLQNLLSNALKFSPRGGVIRVYRESDDPLALCVADQGKGIPVSMREHLFSHERRVSFPGTEGERGNGLGLPLCAEIMHAHGGAIDIVSHEGPGAVIRLAFPPMPKNVRVMVVDDDELHREVLARNLMQIFPQVEVTQAGDGQEAIRKLQETDGVDLLITDLSMPHMDGMQLLAQIKESPTLRSTPSIMLSSMFDDEKRNRAMALGSLAYCVKPMDAEKLAVTLMQCGFTAERKNGRAPQETVS
ncbi:MAG: response regulator [Nitrospinae bacterium]|nr:response regulator [Nitrospinota bacterium]